MRIHIPMNTVPPGWGSQYLEEVVGSRYRWGRSLRGGGSSYLEEVVDPGLAGLCGLLRGRARAGGRCGRLCLPRAAGGVLALLLLQQLRALVQKIVQELVRVLSTRRSPDTPSDPSPPPQIPRHPLRSPNTPSDPSAPPQIPRHPLGSP